MTRTPLVSLGPPDPADWLVVNDNVMGGRSLGSLSVGPTAVQFLGALDTVGGGFASFRSQGLLVGLGGCTAIHLQVRGDGREWSCDLRAAATVEGFGVTWKATFSTQAGLATLVRLPLESFRPTWRGEPVPPERIPADAPFPDAMQSIGFTIADGRDGAFRLEVLAVEGELRG
ncbi:MAG: CIA30 family protein [Gemmatimonadales bacterium]